MATVFKRNGKGPWIIQFFDAQGRRRERSTRTTDKRAADRIAAQLGAGVALRREGIIDPRMDRYSAENAKPIAKHVADYLAHLEHARRSPSTRRDARVHLEWLVKETGAARLHDLSLDNVERALSLLQAQGRAARTVNHRGGSAAAFLNWAVKTGRIDANPLRFLPKQDEARDRRRTRRALSDDEIARLMEVAERKGRRLWYLAALWAGLRRSELVRATWGDVDLARSVLTVRLGKAKRVDEVPLHPDLAAELARCRPASVLPAARIFPEAVTNLTRRRDFLAAGFDLEDDDGRSVDLHALRTTLGTKLARSGVAPQVAQRIMRHASYATTLKHYTKLDLADTTQAMRALSVNAEPQRYPQQSEHDATRSAAM
jgi:integrase